MEIEKILNMNSYNIIELKNKFDNGFLISKNGLIYTIDTCLREKITKTEYFYKKELMEFLASIKLEDYKEAV